MDNMDKEAGTALNLKSTLDKIIKQYGAVVVHLNEDGSQYVLETAEDYVKKHAPVTVVEKIVEKEVPVEDDYMNILYWEDLWNRHN